MKKSDPRAATPTDDEIELAAFYWEYNQITTNVTSPGEPPGSVLPLIHIQRRLVGKWELADDQA